MKIKSIKEIILSSDLSTETREDAINYLLRLVGLECSVGGYNVSTSCFLEIRDYLICEKKINAIKALKDETRIGLKEAKMAVETLQEKLRKQGHLLSSK